MTTIVALKFVSQQITLYFGLTILITGVIGGILNIIIFTTLKSFRQTTCAFFLIVASIVNIGQLLTGTLVFILGEGFYIDLRKMSWFCKIHIFLVQGCVFISLSSICLATIDQFLSMSKCRHFSNLRLAQRCVIIACIFALAHGIFALINFGAPQGICTIVNPTFAKYVSYFQFPVLFGCLPITIMVTFSLLAFFSARTVASRQVNIVRLRRDRQLTAMVLVHIVFIVLTTLPYIIFYIYVLNQNNTDSEQMARNQLTNTIIVLITFSSCTGSFYLYCCVSRRFRKQLVYVLVNIWMNRWRQWINNLNNNIIVPTVDATTERHPVETVPFTIETISLHQITI